MFLHIGNNIIIKQNEIVGIYNIKSLKKTDEYEKMLNNLKEKNKLIFNDNTEENTLIITEKNKKIKAYITNISSVTIAKRLENNIINIKK